MKKNILTLCIIEKEGKILLGMKKRGFGAGRWNGFGGKVEESESIEDAARREVFEECGLIVKSLVKKGEIRFEFDDGTPGRIVHIFKADDFDGEIKESDEMRPEWFEADAIPIKEMWAADAYWFPMFLEGKSFEGEFLYDRPTTPDRAAVIVRKDLCERAEPGERSLPKPR
ncbi:MAG TPA: 8-oxo-dGTP diphosphatase [Candidatus Fimivivens sp.]|nr:8-oxo-dGTP diphosphatase [Candidatus Fimivivens sp.]